MLGTVDRDWAGALLERLAAQDARGVLEQIDRMAEFSPDYMAVLAELLSELHRIAVYQMIAEGKPEELSEYEDIKTLAARITPEECQLFYQIALIGRRDLPLVPDPRRGLEMILLRMLAFYRETLPVADTLGEKTSLPPVIPLSDQGQKTLPAVQAQESAQAWHRMIEPLPLSGLVRELALNCVLKSQDGNRCRLLLPPSAQHLWSEKLESRLEQILRIHYGNDLQITITVADLDGQVTPLLEEAQLREQQERQAAAQAIGQDPNVKALCEAFSAQVTAIRPGGP